MIYIYIVVLEFLLAFAGVGFESSWRMKEFTDEKNIPFWEISKEGETIELPE